MLSVRSGHHRAALAGRSLPCTGLAGARRPPGLLTPPVRGLGGDAVDGFLDLAKLLSGSSGSGKKTPYDNLAAAVGKDVYVDVAGWHLYMRDMSGVQGLKMSQVLAATLGPKAKQGLKKADVEDFLRKVPIKLGQGKLQVSLFDVMPSACVSDLVRLVQDHADD